MPTPAWQPGHTYLPGDLVQPRSGSIGATLPANLDFALGDTEWTKEAGWAINNFPGVTGAWRADFGGSGNAEIINNVKVPVVPGQRIEVHAYGMTQGPNVFAVGLEFYDASMVQLPGASGSYRSPEVGNNSNTGWQPCGGTATVPADAAYAAMVGTVTKSGPNAISMSDFTWNYQVPAASVGLIFKAVQAGAGVSAEVEPTWPTVNGVTVVDNTVTWEAVQISRVVWKAVPILKSGGTEPTWPTTPGGVVADGSIVWECITRQVTDENCPHSKTVVIAAGKVYSGDEDITRFCATANPLDWTTENDAGYLPTGLQQANANNVAVLNLYRGNIAVFNASTFQMWQADPDPAAMAILDQMEGIGSTWPRAAQAVGNDLLFLSQLGVRSVGIAGASTNLQAGDVGMPVDVLVQDSLTADRVKPIATYYPSAGQYWLAFSRLPPHPLVITGDIPDGDVGESVSGAYTAVGDAGGPYSFTLSAGTLPPGIGLNDDGTWSGTFTTAGSYEWTVLAIDSEGTQGTLADDALVAAVPATFSTTRLENGALTDSNRVLTLSGADNAASTLNTIKSTGKWYAEFEVLVTGLVANSIKLIAWTRDDTLTPSYTNYAGATDAAEFMGDGTYSVPGDATASAGATFDTVGDVVAIAYDADTREAWVRAASGWVGGGDPAAGTSPTATLAAGTGSMTVAIAFNYSVGYAQSVRMNAGQSAAAYGVPSGFEWVTV